METLGTKLPDRSAIPAIQERRRRPRHRVHTPAYVSLDEPTSGAVLDLSEILNVSEDGVSIQTSSPLHVNQQLSLCLDLSETKSYIHVAGEVVWLDRSGRAGIKFRELGDPSLTELKQWLFANALTACVNHQQDTGKPADASGGVEVYAPSDTVPIAEARVADHSSVLEALEAVQREITGLGQNLDAALQLLAERAHSFVGASGAAIALSHGDEMVCHASSGEAPPVGSRLQVGSGFSGECVRTAQLLRCDDSEFDPIVDLDSCRALDIRSMIAVPVLFGGTVIGLLEVFSPAPFAFTDSDSAVLQRLAEIVMAAVKEASGETEAQSKGAPEELESAEASGVEDALRRHSSTIQRVLIVAAIAAVGVVLTWSFAPSNRSSASDVTPTSIDKSAPAPSAKPTTAPTTIEGLRALAEKGDPVAQFALGARYATGEDVKQDYAEAVRWFSRSAQQGHVVAQATLGAYYWAGRGVPQDLTKAYFWSVLAQAGGDEASKYRVAVLTSRMNRAQVVAAQQQANDWIRQHQGESSGQSSR